MRRPEAVIPTPLRSISEDPPAPLSVLDTEVEPAAIVMPATGKPPRLQLRQSSHQPAHDNGPHLRPHLSPRLRETRRDVKKLAETRRVALYSRFSAPSVRSPTACNPDRGGSPLRLQDVSGDAPQRARMRL